MKNVRKKNYMYASAILFILVGITSCDKDDEINPANFSITDTEKNFGDVEVNQTKDATFTITNTGDADLEITGFEMKGTNAAEFSTSATIETLAAGETKTITVVFEPTNEGEKSASLEVTTNAGVKVIALSGTATATPTPTPKPVMEFSQSSINFGTVGLGQELSKTITVSNTGDADLEITNANISEGSTASYFTVVGGTSSLIRTIAPGDSYTFEVKFTPATGGYASASISLSTNSSASAVGLSMSGTGAQPAIVFSETGLYFGDVEVGNSSNILTFAIQNNGQADLEINSITLSGSIGDYVLVDVSAPRTIAPNGVYEVSARFRPESAGVKNAMIVVGSNDPIKPSYAISLSGTGI